MSRRPINFDTDRRRVRSRSRGNRLERETEEPRIYGGGERVGRSRGQRSFHDELDDLEAEVKKATTVDQPVDETAGVQRLAPLNSNYLRQKDSRIPVPIKDESRKDEPPKLRHPNMDDIINKFSSKVDLDKGDETKSAILEKHKQFVKPRITNETYNPCETERDREFEERRLKIQLEQDLIYEQEEQHFREVVEAETESGNQGIDIDGKNRQYQAALHQEIAALETLEHNPIKLFTLEEKSYGTIESRESDIYCSTLNRTLNDADDANSELATDDFQFEEKYQAEKAQRGNFEEADFPPPPPAQKEEVESFSSNPFEMNKPRKPPKVVNAQAKAWSLPKPQNETRTSSSEPQYPHPILFAMENATRNKTDFKPEVNPEFKTEPKVEIEPEVELEVKTQFKTRPSYADERPINGSGNYNLENYELDKYQKQEEKPLDEPLVVEPSVVQPVSTRQNLAYNETKSDYRSELRSERQSVQSEPPVMSDLKPVPQNRYEPNQTVAESYTQKPSYFQKTEAPPKKVDRLLNKFSENTESSYLSRPSDRLSRSSSSSNTSSNFQNRISSTNEKPKIKLQPTQYGRTQFIAKANTDFSYTSIRRNEKTPVSSLINRFNPTPLNQAPSKGEDWMPATLKRVKRPSVKSQIAGLEKLKERPDQPSNTPKYSSKGLYKERNYFEH